MKDGDLAVFCNQLALVLKAGMTLHEGIMIMTEDLKHEGYLETTLKVIQKELNEGKSLSKALIKEGSFPDYMIDMIEIGTKAGRLEEVMEALGNYYEGEELLKKNIKSAVFYPLLLSFMMVVVILVLCTKVLPIFQEVYRNLGGEMPGIAQGFLQFGLGISRYIYAVIASIIALGVGGLWMMGTKAGKRTTKRIVGRCRLAEKISTARFAAAMSLMIASGLDTEETLRMASKMVEHKRVKIKIEACKAKLEEGQSFVKAMTETQIFSQLLTKMLVMGMRTGHMDQVMGHIANQYQEEVDEALRKRIAIIEPIAVAGLAIIIGSILLSVMLPLMEIMSSIG